MAGRHTAVKVRWADERRGEHHQADADSKDLRRQARREKRTPPMATLFIAIIETVVALGNGLNCMAATQKPPVNASINRLRCSAW